MANHDLSSYNAFVSFNLSLSGVTVFLSITFLSLLSLLCASLMHTDTVQCSEKRREKCFPYFK